MEVAVASFALPHGCGVQAKGGVQLSQVRLIWAAVLVVLVPDYHVLQAIHIASPPCTHRAGVGVMAGLGHPGRMAPRTTQAFKLLGIETTLSPVQACPWFIGEETEAQRWDHP